jgi:hypothetical protein
MKAAPGQEPSGASPAYHPFAPPWRESFHVVLRSPGRTRAGTPTRLRRPRTEPSLRDRPRGGPGHPRAPSKFRLVSDEGQDRCGPTSTIRPAAAPRSKLLTENQMLGSRADRRSEAATKDPPDLHQLVHQRLRTTVDILGPNPSIRPDHGPMCTSWWVLLPTTDQMAGQRPGEIRQLGSGVCLGQPTVVFDDFLSWRDHRTQLGAELGQ